MPAHARVEQRRDEQLLRVLPTGEFAETIRVPVHFHSIERNETEEGGHLTDEQIHEQIAVMNADFASTGFAFDIKSITRTSSAVFFAEVGDGTPQEALMKQQLRRGTASELNLYTVGFESNAGLLGFSSFPQDYHRNPIRDGVVVRYNSLPAHPPNPDRMGRTATHETGHWLGLYHTFQGGCSDTAGDFVVDTAAEATPNYACPANRDTCPTLEGLDPVDNFMDYSSDSCMTTFTPGQAERMRQFWSAFRQNQ
ncbi:hypothetical protein CXG81DRAFT_9115 [Caulochytrium protostelioides]|uniref:Zincin n=1 Tax=Caulochytrium protostelioides TaxID=1555241 RepID=A0A4P9XF32_9FUNG|nr:zincin [Caulochytrium protostelioides]RKP03801.1 hypothetical protein CXG81DRAFT_9115 [Caulochytrium protostelioides]|eukprot:RKP03801.1 hypothetical protein CXG81DRAFT_9115 [Caulochytrium protostelioides]